MRAQKDVQGEGEWLQVLPSATPASCVPSGQESSTITVEIKAFSTVRCQQPCSGWTAAVAAAVRKHKSVGFFPHAGILPNSLSD